MKPLGAAFSSIVVATLLASSADGNLLTDHIKAAAAQHTGSYTRTERSEIYTIEFTHPPDGEQALASYTIMNDGAKFLTLTLFGRAPDGQRTVTVIIDKDADGTPDLMITSSAASAEEAYRAIREHRALPKRLDPATAAIYGTYMRILEGPITAELGAPR